MTEQKMHYRLYKAKKTLDRCCRSDDGVIWNEHA